MALDPTPVLSQIRKTLEDPSGDPDAEALRRIRAILDEPALFAQISEYLQRGNDPDVKAKIVTDIIAILRHCSDRSAHRKNELTNVRYGIAGGTAMVAGGLIAFSAGSVLVLGVIIGGALVVLNCLSRTGVLSAEEQIYADIAARAAKIRERFDAT